MDDGLARARSVSMLRASAGNAEVARAMECGPTRGRLSSRPSAGAADVVAISRAEVVRRAGELAARFEEHEPTVKRCPRCIGARAVRAASEAVNAERLTSAVGRPPIKDTHGLRSR